MRSCVILFFVVLFCACNTTPPYETIDGVLEVPENRNNLNSRTLKLIYKVLKAKDTNSRKAPIVILQGGPGGATMPLEAMWENHPLRNDRDIVLMDQRGTGESEANCADMGNDMFAILRQDLDDKGEIRVLDDLMSECKKNMKNDGVDLAGYTSKENAADFEDLRKELGYEQWNLIGGSYGSRLGLTIMRDFPKSVRSAVLSAILAPETNYFNDSMLNFENSLFSVLERCEQNEVCNNRYPNLKERLFKTLKKMRTAPLRFDYNGKLFVLNAQDALALLHMLLYERESIAFIPLYIETLESGKPKSIIKALEHLELLINFINWPMNYSVMTYEELPFYDELAMEEYLKQSEIAASLSLSIDPTMELMNNWHSFRAKEDENQPVISEIPTLMTSGGLDHVTPINNAKEALKHLKNGYEVIFPDEGHNLYNPCFLKIIEDFLNDPFHKPNVECSSIRNPIEWNLDKPAL